MNYISIYLLFLMVILFSCRSSKFSRSGSWQNEYKDVAHSIVLQKKFDCYYHPDVKDKDLKEFMSRENLYHICYNPSKEPSKPYEYSTITFYFDYNPMFGKKRILLYKLDSSKKMDDLVSLIPADRKIKRINNEFVYIVVKSPGFY